MSAGYPDPAVRAAGIMRGLPDRVSPDLAVSPALRDGVTRQLEDLLGIVGHTPGGARPTTPEQLADLASDAENAKRWDTLLREGWTGAIDGRLVWIKPRLEDVQSQVAKKDGGQETKFVVVFGSTAAETTQERSSSHAGTVGPDALFSMGNALVSLQVPFEFDYQRSASNTSTYRVLSGRKLFFNGGPAYTSGLAVDLYVDGTRWGTGTIPRAADSMLITQFPSPYLTRADPTPRPPAGQAAADTAAERAKAEARAKEEPAGAHEVLTAIHLDPAVAALHRALRASNLPPAAAAAVAERFTRMLLNERTALARSRWLFHHGDSSEELVVPIDAGRDFRGHLTVEFVVKRLQYLDTASEVTIRDDLGVVRGTSTSSTTAVSASVPLPRISGNRRRHGGGGPAVEMDVGRAVNDQVGNQGMNHPILVRTSDHERHAAEIQVNLKFSSETHRVGWQSEMVWAEFGVPKDDRAAFEIRHVGGLISAPGTWHDAVAPSMAVTPADLRRRSVADNAPELGRVRKNAPQVREPHRPAAPPKAGGAHREPLALAARRGDGVGTTIGLPGGHMVAPYVMAALRETAGWQLSVREHVGMDDFSPGTQSWAQVQFRVGLRYGLMALEADPGRLKTGIYSTFDISGRTVHVLVTARTLDLVGQQRYKMRVNDRALSTSDTGTGVTTSVGGYLGLTGSITLFQDRPVQMQIPGMQVGVGYEHSSERSRSRSVKSYRRFETDSEVVQFDYALAYEITVWTDPGTPHRWLLAGSDIQQQVVVSDELLPKASPPATAGAIGVEVFPSGQRPPAIPNNQEPVPFHSQGVSGVYPRFVELPELPALVARLYGEVTGRDGGWHRNPRNWPAELWDAGLAVPTELGAFFADLTAGDHRWSITLDRRADRTTVVEISARIYDVRHLGDSTGVEVEQYAQATSQFDSGSESEWSGRAALGLGPVGRIGHAEQGADDESSGHTVGGYGAARYSRSWSSSTAVGSGSIDITRATYKGQVHTYRAGRVRFEVTVTSWAGGKVPPTRREATLDLHNGLEFHVPNRIAWGLGLPQATETGRPASPPTEADKGKSPHRPDARPLRRELDPHVGRASSHVEQLRSDNPPLVLILDTLADRGVLARDGQGPPDPLRESLSRTFSMGALELQAFALFGSGVAEWFAVPGPFGTGYLFVRVSATLGTVRSDRERFETNLTLRGESVVSDDGDSSTGSSTALAAAFRGRGSFATSMAGGAARYEHTWDASRSQGQEHSVTTIFRHGTKKSYEFVNDVQFTIDLRYTLRTGTWEDRRSTSGSVRRLVPETLTAPAGPPAGTRGPQWESLARVGQPTDVSRRYESPELNAGLNRLVAGDPTFIPLAFPINERLRRNLAQALSRTGELSRAGTGFAGYLRGLTAFTVGDSLVDADQFVAESNLRPRMQALLAHQYQVPGTSVRLGVVLTEVAQLLDGNGLPLTPTYKSRQYAQDETTPVTGRSTASGAHGGVIPEIAGRDIGPATLFGGRGGWKGGRDGGRDSAAELAETSEYNTESSANHTYYRYRVTVVAHLPGGQTVEFPSADGLYGLSRRSPDDLLAANPALSERLVNGRVFTRERLARSVDRAVSAAGPNADGPRMLAALSAQLYPAGVGARPVDSDEVVHLPSPERWQPPPSREAIVALVRSSPPGSSALVLTTDLSAGYVVYHTIEGEIHWVDARAATDDRLTRVADASTEGAPRRVPGAGGPSDLRVVILGPDGSVRPAPPRRPSLDTSGPPSPLPPPPLPPSTVAAVSAPPGPDVREQHQRMIPIPATPTPAGGTAEAGDRRAWAHSGRGRQERAARERAILAPLPHPLRHVADPEEVRTAPLRTTDHQVPERPTTTGSASGETVPSPSSAPARTAPLRTTTTAGGWLGDRPAPAAAAGRRADNPAVPPAREPAEPASRSDGTVLPPSSAKQSPSTHEVPETGSAIPAPPVPVDDTLIVPGLATMVDPADRADVLYGPALRERLATARAGSPDADLSPDAAAGARTLAWIKRWAAAETSDAALDAMWPGGPDAGSTMAVTLVVGARGDAETLRTLGTSLESVVHRELNLGLTRWAQRRNSPVRPRVTVEYSAADPAALDAARDPRTDSTADWVRLRTVGSRPTPRVHAVPRTPASPEVHAAVREAAEEAAQLAVSAHHASVDGPRVTLIGQHHEGPDESAARTARARVQLLFQAELRNAVRRLLLDGEPDDVGLDGKVNAVVNGVSTRTVLRQAPGGSPHPPPTQISIRPPTLPPAAPAAATPGQVDSARHPATGRTTAVTPFRGSPPPEVRAQVREVVTEVARLAVSAHRTSTGGPRVTLVGQHQPGSGEEGRARASRAMVQLLFRQELRAAVSEALAEDRAVAAVNARHDAKRADADPPTADEIRDAVATARQTPPTSAEIDAVVNTVDVRVAMELRDAPPLSGPPPTTLIRVEPPPLPPPVRDAKMPVRDPLSTWNTGGAGVRDSRSGWWATTSTAQRVDDIVTALPAAAFRTVSGETGDVTDPIGEPVLVGRYSAQVRYDVARVELSETTAQGTVVDTTMVRVFRLRLHLRPGDGVSRVEVARLRRQAERAVRQMNERLRLPEGDQFHLRVEFTGEAEAQHVIDVPQALADPGVNATSATWPVSLLRHAEPAADPSATPAADPRGEQFVQDVLLHEMLHLLGLNDEYPSERSLGPDARPVRVFAAPPPRSPASGDPDRRPLDRMPRRTAHPGLMGFLPNRDGVTDLIAVRYLWRIWQTQENAVFVPVTKVRRVGRNIDSVTLPFAPSTPVPARMAAGSPAGTPAAANVAVRLRRTDDARTRAALLSLPHPLTPESASAPRAATDVSAGAVGGTVDPGEPTRSTPSRSDDAPAAGLESQAADRREQQARSRAGLRPLPYPYGVGNDAPSSFLSGRPAHQDRQPMPAPHAVAILNEAIHAVSGSSGRRHDDLARWIHDTETRSVSRDFADCVALAWAAYVVRYGRVGNRASTDAVTTPRFADLTQALDGAPVVTPNPSTLVDTLAPGEAVLVRETFHRGHVFWLMADARPDDDGRTVVRVVDPQNPGRYDTPFRFDAAGGDGWSRALTAPGTRTLRIDGSGHPVPTLPDSIAPATGGTDPAGRTVDALVDTGSHGEPGASGSELETWVTTNAETHDVAESRFIKVVTDRRNHRTVLELATRPYNNLDGETEFADRRQVLDAVRAEHQHLMGLNSYAFPQLRQVFSRERGYQADREAARAVVTDKSPEVYLQHTTGVHPSGLHDLMRFAAENTRTGESRHRDILRASLAFGDAVAAAYAGVHPRDVPLLAADFDVMTVRGFAAIMFEHALASAAWVARGRNGLIKHDLPVASRLSLAGMHATTPPRVQGWLATNAPMIRDLFERHATAADPEIGEYVTSTGLTGPLDIPSQGGVGEAGTRVDYTIREYLDNALLGFSEDVRYLGQHEAAAIRTDFVSASPAPAGGFPVSPQELRYFGPESLVSLDQALTYVDQIDEAARQIDRRSRRMLRHPDPGGREQPLTVDFGKGRRDLSVSAGDRIDAIAYQIVRDAVRAWAVRRTTTRIVVEGGGRRGQSGASAERAQAVTNVLRSATRRVLGDIQALLGDTALPDGLLEVVSRDRRDDPWSGKPELAGRTLSDEERRQVHIWTEPQRPDGPSPAG
ncbi:hypothetical protein ACFOOK_00905 [Micromonospora krabiensis]|uniref:hypothetical protein n=1 Tax=Micromonospora krabiensis TaxID=307121 RepID=UPI0036215F3F